MPLPQSKYDEQRQPLTVPASTPPAVQPHPQVMRGYELLGQIRVAMSELSGILGDLRDENSLLRAKVEKTERGEDEDLFRGEVKG